MKKLMTLVGGLLLLFPLFGQVDQLDRIELSVDELKEEFTVVSMGKNGLIAFGELDEPSKGGKVKWRFIKYDTNFKKVDSKTITLDKKYYLQEDYKDDNKLYLFFNRGYKSTDYTLLKIDATDFKVSRLEGALPKKMIIYKVVIYKNYLYLSGTLKRDMVIAYANLKDRIIKTVPIEYKGDNDVEMIVVNEQEQRVEFIISNYHKNDGYAYIHAYKGNKKVEEIKINPKNDYNLLTAKISLLDNDKRLVAGTYAKRKVGSEGMYISLLSGKKQEYMHYYKFEDFENFFDYLSEKRQEKIQKKKEKKNKKGKDLKLRYQLLVHDVIEQDDRYIFIAEAYYAVYTTRQVPVTTVVNGVTQTVYQTESVFAGYQYTHGVITAFDKEGKLLWDNCFELNNRSFRLQRRIKVKIEGERIKMLYVSGRSVGSKVIVGNKIIEEESITDTKTNSETEKLKWSTSNVEYWYDDYFLMWGKQKVKEKDNKKAKKLRAKGQKKKRRIFYVNKLKLKG